MKRLVVRYPICLCLLGAALSLLSSPASAQQPTQAAQQPTQAQIDTIRKACPRRLPDILRQADLRRSTA